MFNEIINFIRDTYQTKDTIPLHEPSFNGNEDNYLKQVIESGYVSGIGKFVDHFEDQIRDYTKTSKAVATTNGTSALHASLYLSDVKQDDFVITQSLTFIATCNAIHYLGARPIFIDIDLENLSLCPKSLETWLIQNAEINSRGICVEKNTKKFIKAVIPMHTFGHPAKLDELNQIAKRWNLSLIEDAAESLGSFYKDRHTGTIGRFGALSFNGNKIITTGGGGMILCKDQKEGHHMKHITTTAKISHEYEYIYEEHGFNYRLPNVNAAIGCAQMEKLDEFLSSKRKLAASYESFFKDTNITFLKEPVNCRSNYWLNTILVENKEHRDSLLKETNSCGIMTRPVWKLMHKLPMFDRDLRGDLSNSLWAEDRIINLPSTPL